MSAKAFTTGTHRVVPPEDTVERLGPLLDRIGITRVADITGLDRLGVPVVAAYRPDAWSVSVSMGKGATLAAAQASAMMESIELWHAERPLLTQLWGSPAALGEDHALIDWAGLPGAAGARFDVRTSTAWVSAVSMLDGNSALVPYECVHVDGRVPEPAGSGWFACTSNGLASGNNAAEAKVHALCEVIERDAITTWRRTGDALLTTIDPESVSDPLCTSLLARLAMASVAAVLHDATSVVGVPTVQCTLFEPGSDTGRMVYTSAGMGCHPAPAVALARAITEAAQSRLTLISGARDDVFRPKFQLPPDADRMAAGLSRQWLAAHEAGRSFADLPDLATHSVDADLGVVVGALERRSLHPYWVDLSREDIGVAVGRAVVPGLANLAEAGGSPSLKRLAGAEVA